MYNEIYCCSFYVLVLYFCCRSWTSCLDTWHHWFYQIPTDTKSKSDWLCEKSYNGPCLDLPTDNNPKTNLKNNTKLGHWAQNQASAMAISVPWPAPCRKWVRWTEEKHRHGAGKLKGLERFWMKEWSLISCQVFSNLIRHYRRKLLYYFGKWRFQQVLNKRVLLIVSNVY